MTTLETLQPLTKLQTKILAVLLEQSPSHSVTEWEIARTLKTTTSCTMGAVSSLISLGLAKRSGNTIRERLQS